jgi:alkylation response protein AidB-like acyl-CoA dehydrogenase
MSTLASALATLEPLVTGTIAANAARTDREGAFPTENLAALAQSGLLGLTVPVVDGGLGLGLDAASAVVERVAQVCGSTAMILCMHYCGAAVIIAHGDAETRRAIAAGTHLSTLAFSEVGSRSHFWAPQSTARVEQDSVVLDAQKSWITTATHATAYVWSSQPAEAEGASTLWLVPNPSPGLRIVAPYDGLGLRGNDSSPVLAEGVRIPAANRLGPDGKGFDLMMGVVLPTFNVLNASVNLGLCNAAVAGTAGHVGGTRHADAGTSLADLPTIRAYLARMKLKTDLLAALLADTLAALGSGRADAMLRVLEIKAAGGETATEVTSTAMRVCGGAAYRREVGVERPFRDAQAATTMGPTTDVLYDFIGKAVAGLPLF